MRVLLIGPSGDVGKAAVAELSRRHEVITAGRSTGAHTVDFMDEGSVRALFEKVGRVDAIVVTTGHGHFGPVSTMTPEQFRKGLGNKLMGQITVALVGQHYLNDGGSITLTSGVLDRDPVRGGANGAAINGALGAFAKSASIELPRGLRINVVSPGLLEASEKRYEGYFPGHEMVSSARVGLAYAKSVEGAVTGQVIIVE